MGPVPPGKIIIATNRRNWYNDFNINTRGGDAMNIILLAVIIGAIGGTVSAIKNPKPTDTKKAKSILALLILTPIYTLAGLIKHADK